MNIVIKRTYITTDGKEFINRRAARNHQRIITIIASHTAKKREFSVFSCFLRLALRTKKWDNC